MKKTKILTLFVMLFLVLSITVFAAGTEEVTTPTGPVLFQFYHGLPGDNGKIFEKMIVEFNRSQDEVIVEPIFMPDYTTLAQKLTAAIASNTAPALAQLSDGNLWKMAEAGVLLSLNDFMAQPDYQAVKDDYVQGFIDVTTVDGHVYGLPMQRSTPILYYRKDILAKNEIDVSQLITYEGLREAAKKLKASGDAKWGFEPLHNPWFMISALRSNGVKFFNDDFTEATFGTPAAIEVFQYHHDLVWKDKSSFVHYGGSGWQYWINSEYDLVNGNSAMYTGSTGDMGGNIKKGAEFGVPKENIGSTFMPKFEGGQHSVPFGGTSGAIIKNVSPEKQEAAWKFLRWFSEPKQTAAWSEATGYLPTRYSAKHFMDLNDKPYLGVALEQLQYALNEPKTTVWNEIRGGAIKNLIDKIYLEEDVDVAAAVAQAVKEANAVIKNQ